MERPVRERAVVETQIDTRQRSLDLAATPRVVHTSSSVLRNRTMTSRRPAHSLPGSFVKEKRSSFKPSFKGVGDALENISSGDEASFTKGHEDEPRRVAHSALAAIFSTLQHHICALRRPQKTRHALQVGPRRLVGERGAAVGRDARAAADGRRSPTRRKALLD